VRDGSKDIADAVCGLCWLLEKTQLTQSTGVQVVGQIPDKAKIINTSTARTSFSTSRKAYKQAKLFS
jgi:hypothetical protein